jgi:hypothetical protein
VVTWNDFGEGSVVEPTQEYGYRDLGMLQDLRRQYLQPDFSGSTNDLGMALQFYQLRRGFSTNTAISAELDQVFANLVSRKVALSRKQLDALAKPLNN